MNDKSFNSALLLAIVLTLAALIAQQYFPKKRLLVWPNAQLISYFYSTALPDGTPAAFWLDQSKGLWRCTYPENDKTEYFACSFNMLFANGTSEGINIADYSQLTFSAKYHDNAKKLRIHMRNFDPAYSKVEDSNSSKFNALTLHTRDLNTELHINLDEFSVADWWLGQYDIPRALSQADLRNVISLGIDFVEMKPGNHDLQIEKIEFTGEWVSAEKWYLFILICWMLGIFSYAVAKLVQLRKQTKHDVQVINELNKSNEQLRDETNKFRRLSTVDPLTQTYNRFGIDQIVSTLISANQDKAGQPDFALILLDIDYFKRINDRRGHDAGDRILQTIAALISKAIRTQDFVGRWGGEEFIVLLPTTRKEFALALAEKIRLMIFDTVFEADNPLAVTASIGVSEKLADEDFATAFKRADTALYQAKASGRNCCVMTNNPEDI